MGEMQNLLKIVKDEGGKAYLLNGNKTLLHYAVDFNLAWPITEMGRLNQAAYMKMYRIQDNTMTKVFVTKCINFEHDRRPIDFALQKLKEAKPLSVALAQEIVRCLEHEL